jgi:hypothetical protein
MVAHPHGMRNRGVKGGILGKDLCRRGRPDFIMGLRQAGPQPLFHLGPDGIWPASRK